MADTADASFDTAPLALASDFPPSSQEDWLAAVEKVLKGADFEKRLISRSLDDIPIMPLATRADWPGETDPAGFPGLAPFTRGTRPLANAAGGWDLRQRHSHPDPETANAQIIQDLERGVTSIQLAVDTGQSDGGDGVLVPDARTLDAVLDRVLLDLAPIALEPVRGDGLAPAAMMLAVWDRRGHDAASVGGALNVDPLGAAARGGAPAGTLEAGIARAADLAVSVSQARPNVTTLLSDARPYHDAGASEAQELAAGLATAVAYLRAMEKAGLEPETAARQIAFTLTADTDLFLTIAKLRAARRLWHRVTAACGANEAAGVMSLHVQTSGRMMSVRDPWVNILRTTIAAFGAGVGGATSMTVLPFTAAIGQPDSLARRIARNIQIVLLEETGLGRVVDPAGGAWSLEQLTDRLAQEAWSGFQQIEAEGGMAASLASGALAARIQTVRTTRATAIAKRAQPITGVSEFPNLTEKQVTVETPDRAALTKQAKAYIAGRRSEKAVSESVAALRDAVQSASPQETSKALLEAATKEAPARDLEEVLATPGQSGERVAPLPATRLGEAYEALRTASDRHMAHTGQRPRVLMIPLGSLADSTARAGFARNLFAAGGLEAHDPGPLPGAEEAAKAFRAAPSPVVILCSSTDVYSRLGADTVAALRKAGAMHIVLAGRDKELPEGTKVDRTVFAGCDVLATLRDAHARLGIAPAH